MEKMDGWREVKLLDGTEGRLAGRKLNFTWKICDIKHKFQPRGDFEIYQFLNLETTESAVFCHENGHIYQAACSASIYRILQWGLIGQKLCRAKAVCLIL